MSDIRPNTYTTIGGYRSSAVSPTVPDSHIGPTDPNPVYHWWHPAYWSRRHRNPLTNNLKPPTYTPGSGLPVQSPASIGNKPPDGGPHYPIDPVIPIFRHIPVWGGNPPRRQPLPPPHRRESWR